MIHFIKDLEITENVNGDVNWPEGSLGKFTTTCGPTDVRVDVVLSES